VGAQPPPRFGPENIGNATETWFGKIFRLVIVYKWSRLAKYYFLGLFEQLHPDFSEHLEELQRSCFGTDIDCGRLGHQLDHVHDAVKATLPEVRQVTNIRTIHEAFNKTPVTKTLIGEVHKLLRVLDIYTCGIGDFRAHVFFPAPHENLPWKYHE